MERKTSVLRFWKTSVASSILDFTNTQGTEKGVAAFLEKQPKCDVTWK